MRRGTIAAMLGGRDRRSIGRSHDVVAIVLREPHRFPVLIKCLWHEDPLVRMRAADAAEKISVVKPELLKPYKAELLGLLAGADQTELRWHLALMVPRLPLTAEERHGVAATFEGYLEDQSSLVRTFALQGLADLSRNDAGLGRPMRKLLEASARAGTPAMKARARKLLKEL